MIIPSQNAAQHGVHADGWILTAKMAFIVALSYFRFVGVSRPSSRRYPANCTRGLRVPLARFLQMRISGEILIEAM